MTWTATTGTTYNPTAWERAASGGMANSHWIPDRQQVPTNPDTWSFQTPVVAAGTERDLVNARNTEVHMTVDASSDAGDGTVPATASGAQIVNYPGCRVGCALSGFDHQGDYDDDHARAVLLDALVRLVAPVKVTC